jgi:PleD family two-component response regulator
MIIALVDDLLVCSRIRAAAREAGAPLRFARSPEAFRQAVAAGPPSLVILDLDADRLEPLEAVATLKADPATMTVRTVGFVSHVRADRVAAARAAGVGEVLARSAFAANLPAILEAAK